MDYKKKSLNKMNRSESYEEIDTRLASGWYVDAVGSTKTKKYKTKKVSYKISRKVWKTLPLKNLLKKLISLYFSRNHCIN